MLPEFVLLLLQVLSGLFIFTIGFGALVVVGIYVVDRTQTRHAVSRNYPVIGRFRYLFEHLGEFFRQYFFAMDREELPFNRAQRSWVYRAAKDLDRTVPFGSTRNQMQIGSVLLVNSPFPVLEENALAPEPRIVGPDCPTPYVARSIFNVSGMSYGAISKPAVLALSEGAHAVGCWMNTGEGGLSAHHLVGGADIVFQIGTAKHGVCDAEGRLSEDRLRAVAAEERVRMFEIKLSQGAKPGKGGILPGAKVTEEIAAIRRVPAGEDAISPNRHPEIRSSGDLLDMVDRVRSITGKPVGFKLCLGDADWLEELFTTVDARGAASAPDFITVDGGDGGTGAAPMALMDDVGLPVRESLPLLVDRLDAHGLRPRVRVIASGKLIAPVDVAWALCMGADFVVSARGFMLALGCIQAMQCNKNTCPTGITTHNPRLQRGLVPADKALRVAHYHENLMREVCIIAHSCGVSSPNELRRRHARMVVAPGRTMRFDEIYPPARSKEPAAAAGR